MWWWRKRDNVEKWIAKLKSRNSDIRRKAVETLGEIGDHRTTEPLIRALKDDMWLVRWEAAGALGKIGDVRAVKPLIQALRDKDWNVRRTVVWALGKIGDIRAVEPLIQALEDKQPDVRGEAAKALGDIGDAHSVKPLLRTLEMDENWYTRGEAAEALSKIHDPLVIETFRKALVKDEHWYVRAIAIQYLEEVVDKHEIELSITASKDADSSVREKATEILKKVCGPIKRVLFGYCDFKDLDPCTTLQNIDTTELTMPLSNLERIEIHAETYVFHLVERFITYAVNYIGQDYLKNNVEVHIYGDPSKLHPNLRNSFKNLCKSIEVHQ